ncbi:hypothetical protein SUNI508_07960 [Seiridium unicorne]|uniref:Uncharacterized protein n=1 Tax=Seiridium unicorne TaxID=138068 RepID=A0ABR2UV19_9PEZI
MSKLLFLIRLITFIKNKSPTLTKHKPFYLSARASLMNLIQVRRSALPCRNQQHLSVQALPPVHLVQLGLTHVSETLQREVIREVELHEPRVLSHGDDGLRQRHPVVRDRRPHEADAGPDEEACGPGAREET